MKKKLLDGYLWSGEQLTNIQATTRPDHLWQEIWSRMSKGGQRREKQQRVIEKPKLDNARKLSRIFFIDLESIEFNNTKKDRKKWNCQRKLFFVRSRTTPCRETCGQSDSRNMKHACIVDAHESTRKLLKKKNQPKDRDDRIAKTFISLSHYNHVRKFIPFLQGTVNPGCKSRFGQRVGEARKIVCTANGQVKSKTEVIHKAQTEQGTVHFGTLVDICHIKKAGLQPKFQKCKGRVVLRGDTVKNDSGFMHHQAKFLFP